ncbi:TonB-dependent receptor domain-containing protein [Caulobacter segnis]|uniref:TonB-dependent receptor n=1 Tax=Caulobacter segnis TaxID=88688 RepID=UPI00285706B8|nr:TonB-dependent receptor [Caulobacter segnis]MDR6623874.1 iron complex outermembrane receptor protein [Caulobacter segnis]
MTRTAFLTTSCLALVAALATSPAAAQTTMRLRDVEVETNQAEPNGGTAGLSTHVVDHLAASRRAVSSSDLTEILRATPGVAAQGAGGFSSLPSIRGIGEDKVIVTIDGAPVDMACPNFMNSPLSYVDPLTLGSVLVVKGVSPVSFGGDNIGGVIAARSADPKFAEAGQRLFAGETSVFYRSNDDAVGGAVQATIASDRWSVGYAGSGAKARNYRGGAGDGHVRSTEYAKTSHALTVGRRTSVGLFTVKGSLDYSPYEGFPNQWMDMTLNRSWALTGRYQGAFAWGALEVTAYHRDVRHKMNFLDDKGGDADGGMPMDTWVKSTGVTAKADIVLDARQTLRVGGEFHHQALDDSWPAVAGSMMMGPNTYLNVNDGRRDRFGVFAELDTRWSDKLSSVIGVRHDAVSMNTGDVQPYSTGMMSMKDAMAAQAFNAADHEHDDGNWGATALLRYAPIDGVTLEAGYARKTQSPNLYQLYAWGRGAMSSQMIGWYGDGNGYVGNLALKSQKADTFSGAVRFAGGGEDGWRLTVEPFYTRVADFIDARKIADLTNMMGKPSGFVQLQFVNVDAEFRGVDVSAQAPLWSSETFGKARLDATFSALHGENRATGAPLYRQMPLNGRIAVRHAKGPWTSAVELELVAEKDRVDPTRNERKTAAYQLLNVRTAYQWKTVTLSLAVENLANQSYDLPLGGVSLGDYGATGALRQTPGRGRSVDVGLTARF